MKKVILLIISVFLFTLLIPTQTKAERGTESRLLDPINMVDLADADVLPAKTTEVNLKTNPTTLVSTKTDNSVEAYALLTRLTEINAMDISALNSLEKKELRKEVRSIRNDLKTLGESDAKSRSEGNLNGHSSGGIYLSVGAILIIILLLIILL